MAFKFNGFLNFKSSAAIASMNSAKRSFNSLQNSTVMLGQSASMLGQSMRTLGLVTAPMTVGMGLAVNEAMNFEAQISKVQSILLVTKDAMAPLVGLTKELGATTVFTAEQAAEGAESLARAGFTMEETMAALPGVLDAAAASGVTLGEAALVTANQIGMFDLQAKDATKIADTLALTSARTNTEFMQLAEALKFGGPFAKQAGLEFAETASTFGVFANAGIKASLAGTALKNALLRLSRPTEKALELFGGEKSLKNAVLETVDGVTRLRPMEVIMANIATKVEGARDKLEATKLAAELFGLRGTTAFNSFAAQLTKSLQISKLPADRIDRIRESMIRTFGEDEAMKKWGEFIKKDSIPKLVALRFEIQNASGSAKEMARIRLDNLAGQFVLFKSAVSGALIETGSLLTGPLKSGLSVVTDAIQILALGFQAASGPEGVDGVTLALARSDNRFKDFIGTATEFAIGFKEGFGEVRDFAIEAIVGIQEQWVESFGDMDFTAKEYGKASIKLLSILTALSPILLGVGAVIFVITPLMMFLSSTIGVVTSAWGAFAGTIGFIGTVVMGALKFFGILVPLLTVLGSVVTFLANPFVILGGVIAALSLGVVAGIMNIVDRWEVIKNEFWSGQGDFIAAGMAMFTFFLEGIALVFVGAWEMIKDSFSGLIDWMSNKITNFLKDTVVGGLVSKLGSLFSDDDTVKLGTKPIVDDMSSPFKKTEDGGIKFHDDPIIRAKNAVERERIRTLSAPAAPVTGNQNVGPLRESASNSVPQINIGPLQLNGTLSTRIRGRDLNIALTNAQIQQSELNGNTVSPIAKRRAMHYGAQFTA